MGIFSPAPKSRGMSRSEWCVVGLQRVFSGFGDMMSCETRELKSEMRYGNGVFNVEPRSISAKSRKRRGFSRSVIFRVYDRQGGRCAHCSERFERGVFDADHKNNKRWDNRAVNCQLLCRDCHVEKTRRAEYDLRRRRGVGVFS